MLDNKVLVNIYILALDESMEMFLPVNEKVGNVTRLLNTTLFDSIDFERNNKLFNIDTGDVYNSNDLIKKTDIRNGTKLMLV